MLFIHREMVRWSCSNTASVKGCSKSCDIWHWFIWKTVRSKLTKRLITFHFFVNQCHPAPIPRTQSLIILANKMLFSAPRIGVVERNSIFFTLNSNIFLNFLYHTGLSNDIQLYFNKHMNFCTTAQPLYLTKR